jgi:hypothetical protein
VSPAAEHIVMRRHAAAALALAAFVVGGCGSSSTPSANTRSAAQASPTVPLAPVTQTASATLPAPTTTTGATGSGVQACTTKMLTGGFIGQQGAAGHGELGFELHNGSGTVCHTYGYPGVQFLDGAGKPLPTATQRTTTDTFGFAPLVKLKVPAGGTISFRIGVTHGINSSAGCVTASALQVIPPDDTGMLQVPIQGGAYECGTATVSPLRPSTSAYP